VPGDPAQNVLMDFVLPVWLAVGYLCHRAASSATTSGCNESLLHLFAHPDGHPNARGDFLENAVARRDPPGTVRGHAWLNIASAETGHGRQPTSTSDLGLSGAETRQRIHGRFAEHVRKPASALFQSTPRISPIV
jgi:hypothetical protein